MIRQNLQLLVRRLLRNKLQFFITLSGMVLALTAVILAFIFVNDEKGYDGFHTDTKNIFRVNKWNKETTGDKVKLAETPGLMSAQLVADFPEIVSSTRVAPWFDEVLLTYNNKNIKTSKWVFVDSNFFSFFNFKLLQGGDPAEILRGPGKMLITPMLAKALFGDADPTGQAIKGIDNKLYTVAGMVEPAPRQSHIQFDVLVSYATTSGGENYLDFSFMNNWLGQTVYTYVRLQLAAQLAAVNKKLPAFTTKYMPNRTDVYDFYLQPFSSIYLNSYDIRYLRGGKYGSSTFLRTFTLISMLILLIACFNYVNIVTAQSLQRAKEVGVKKILGAQKKQLLLQFLFETIALMFIASLLALVAAFILLPELNNWFQKDIPASTIYQPATLGLVAITIIMTALLSGIVPAIMLSGFKPLSIFQRKFSLSPGGEFSRRVLVTAQLCIGIGLIGGALVLNRQFSFVMSKDLGFKKNQVLNLKTPPGIAEKNAVFRQEVEAIPGVTSVSICGAAMPEGTFTSTVIPERYNDQELPVREFRVDTNYLRTYGLQMKSGRFFGFTSDNSAGGLVINETFANQAGWRDAIGKRIRFSSDTVMYPVIGVLKDFNYSSLHETVMPLVMYLSRRTGNISIQFETAQIKNIIPKLEATWKKFEQRYPFEYTFLDESFAANYGKEKQLVSVILLFTVIAIFIACLGLYGLASFAIVRRTKEIGIRKVLGAPVTGIILLLVKNFAKPVGLAFLVATPIVWYLINDWLQNFAYHIRVGWWLLAIPGVLMLMIVFATVSFQTIKAAVANPVRSLRSE